MEIENLAASGHVLPSPVSLADEELRANFPCLADFMLSAVCSDGALRDMPWLSLGVAEGRLKAFLNDRHNQRTLCVVADTCRDLLLLLNDALSSGHPRWRYGPRQPPSGGRKGR